MDKSGPISCIQLLIHRHILLYVSVRYKVIFARVPGKALGELSKAIKRVEIGGIAVALYGLTSKRGRGFRKEHMSQDSYKENKEQNE